MSVVSDDGKVRVPGEARQMSSDKERMPRDAPDGIREIPLETRRSIM